MGEGRDVTTFHRQVLTAPLMRPAPDADAAILAAVGFAAAHPDQSARPLPGRPVARSLKAVMLGLAVLGIAAPHVFAALVSAIGLALFAAILGWRAVLVCTAPHRARTAPALASEGQLPDQLLPVYTVLIALKDEADSIAQLAAAIAALDYPADRLDVKLLIETGDTATEAAILAAAWPPLTELLVLPAGKPQTKPRALNYGLARAQGALVVVYDAEDRPDPAQLRAAAAAFALAPPSLACVQAPLVGTAPAHSWIGGQWALEYASQFGQILPALAARGLPIALGGTSNHFRRRVLVDVGGWDAWNVTEDADLGLRLARHGAAVGVIAPPTFEAPPETLTVWTAQRSRWLKGFVQTWSVMMRNPGAALRGLGLGGFLSVQLTLGGAVLAALVHGPWLVWCALCAVLPGLTLGPVGGGFALGSYALALALTWAAPGPRGWRRVWLVATLWAYWPLQTLAMARALYGLRTCSHFWAKTPHARPKAV
jgi:glycosyltransferase XagB